uniref:Mitochondrial import inner membrane translocase subunit n=2 Tax=Elaeis guineensis var. tenera TaxID=51953 RepID=A0A6J0PHV8_ELAGV|nr:mitochondrial import inner membrane translocase subunit TIM10 isoform X1 [Elaeis guineensis]
MAQSVVLTLLATWLNASIETSCYAPIIGMAEREMEYRVELFNRLTKTCFDKCIEKRYKESELYMGENSCIDCCVSKYWQVSCIICVKLLELDIYVRHNYINRFNNMK